MSDKRRKAYRALMGAATILLGLNLLHDLHISVDLGPATTGALCALVTVLYLRLTNGRGRGDI